ARPHRRALHPGRRQPEPGGAARPHRQAGRSSAAAARLAAPAALSAGLGGGRLGAARRRRAVRHRPWVEDGGEEDVLLLGQGDAGARLYAAAGRRRHRRRDRLVPRQRVSRPMIALALAALSLATWIYLLLARGGFWRLTLLPPAQPPATWPAI